MKNRLLAFGLSVLFIVGAMIGWRALHAAPSAPGAGGMEQLETRGEKADAHGDSDEEGSAKVTLTEAQRKNAQLGMGIAGPRKIKKVLPLFGRVEANEEHMQRVVPRFPGVVRAVNKRLGDKVEKGELLATVESNESLRTYEIVSEIAGTVIQKELTVGEFVRDDKAIFVIADLSTVWADLSVYRQDFALLREGLQVRVQPDEGTEPIWGTIAYLSPFGAEGTQTMLARVVVPNPKGDLKPGLFVNAQAVTGEVDAPVAVKLSALQTIKDKTVVFVKEGNVYEAREIEPGEQDGEFLEIISGLLPGDEYVAENSFILKAEIEKSEAKDID